MSELETSAAGTSTPGPSKSTATRSLATAERITWALLGAAILAKVGFIIVYARHMRWVMDEFAQGYTGRLVAIGLYTKVAIAKTALPMLAFYGAMKLGHSATEILQLWRAETTLAALLTVAAVALAAHRLHRNICAVLFAVFTLLCFTNFIEHSFRVRHDTFAVLFAVLSVTALLGPGRFFWSTYGSGLLAGTAFLCTQKVVYHVVALFIAHMVLGWREAGGREALVRCLRYSAGAALALLLYGVGFGGFRAARVIGSVFLSPLQQKSHLLSDAAFPGIQHYVWQTLERNTLAYAICGAGVIASLARFRRRPSAEVAVALASGLITILVFLHPQPWPYVFVMCIPFLSLLAPVCIDLVRPRWQSRFVLAATVLLSLSFLRNVAVLSHDNAEQFRVVRDAEAMLRPGDRYFDGVAMLPTREIAGRTPWWWWDAPTLAALRQQLKRGERDNFVSILAQQPKIWILNYRLFLFSKWLDPILSTGTVRVSDVLLASGTAIAPGATVQFRNLWPGTYHLVGSDGRPSTASPVVAGRPCAVPCRISMGMHQVAASDSRPAFLMPSDVVPIGPLPVHARPVDLYADIYDF